MTFGCYNYFKINLWDLFSWTSTISSGKWHLINFVHGDLPTSREQYAERIIMRHLRKLRCISHGNSSRNCPFLKCNPESNCPLRRHWQSCHACVSSPLYTGMVMLWMIMCHLHWTFDCFLWVKRHSAFVACPLMRAWWVGGWRTEQGWGVTELL